MATDLGIPGYDDVTEIGRGASGIVYRARQIELNRPVAIKVIMGMFDDRAESRLERERHVLGALSSHPNIVSVYGSGTTEHGLPYIIMEFAPGGSLADRLANQGPVPWTEACDIGAKLADALSAAHAAHILHRDIKPENVLTSSFGAPMLADFGIARMGGASETRTGVITATIAHASPEVLEGKRPSEASDIYSLASTIYAALSGQAPFVRDTDESIIPVLARVTTEPPPDLRRQGIPDDVCDVLERGLAKDPGQRPSTAREFHSALRGIEVGQSVPELASSPPVALEHIDGESPKAPAATSTKIDNEPVVGGRSRRGLVVGGAVLAAAVLAALAAVAVGGGGSGSERPSSRQADSGARTDAAATSTSSTPLCQGDSKNAAEAAIEEAFLHFLDGAQYPEVSDKVPFIEFMSEPAISPSMLAYFTNSQELNADSSVQVSVQVNRITCKGTSDSGAKLGPKLAGVEYDLVLDGTPVPGIAAPGAAILVGDVWKVTAKTFCDLSAGGDPTIYETLTACLDVSVGDDPSDLV